MPRSNFNRPPRRAAAPALAFAVLALATTTTTASNTSPAASNDGSSHHHRVSAPERRVMKRRRDGSEARAPLPPSEERLPAGAAAPGLTAAVGESVGDYVDVVDEAGRRRRAGDDDGGRRRRARSSDGERKRRRRQQRQSSSQRQSRRFLAAAPDPTPAQTYYVPLPTDDLLYLFDSFSPDDLSGDPIDTAIFVAVSAPGTVLWYDHWEDGYEDNPTNPTSNSTLVLGDGDWTNGCVESIRATMEVPPNWNYTCSSSDADYFSGAEGITFAHETETSTPRDSSVIRYDGGDLIRSSFPVAVTVRSHASSWEEGDRTQPGAAEVFEMSRFGKKFVSPVGEDTKSLAGTAEDPFTRTHLYVMASEDKTEIKFEGSVVANIDRGKTYVRTGVNEGTVLEADKDVQVHLVTGSSGTGYEGRWFALLPYDQWSSDYYTPVSSDGTATAAIYIHNPTENSASDVILDVNSTTSDNRYSMPASHHSTNPGRGVTYALNLEQSTTGTRVSTPDGEKLYALMVMDHKDTLIPPAFGESHDWGHPLLPADMLSSRAVVGWGWGCRDNLCDVLGDSRSVVWVTPTEDATIYVDYDGDGVDDASYVVPKLDQLLLKDVTDDDMSGAVIRAEDGLTGAGVPLAAAWGLDPSTSGLLDTYYAVDVGTVVLPIPYYSVGANIAIDSDHGTDQLGEISPGDTLMITVRLVHEDGDVPPGTVRVVVDTNSSSSNQVEYVPNSTVYTDESGNTVAVTDDATGSAFPLDDDGVLNQYTLPDGEAHAITFLVKVKDPADLTSNAVRVTGHLEMSSHGAFVAPFATDASIHFVDEISVTAAVYAGHDDGLSCQAAYDDVVNGTGGSLVRVPVNANVTYCYFVENRGNSYLTNFDLTDSVGSVWGDGGEPNVTAPGDVHVIYIQTQAPDELDDDGAEINSVTVSGTPTLSDGTYDLGIDPISSGPSVASVQTASFDISNLHHCESFHHTMTVRTTIMQYSVVAYSTGCVNVRVFINDRPMTESERNNATLDHDDWYMMCDAIVRGNGHSAENVTDVPPEYCTPRVVDEGVTRHFYIAVTEIDPETCDDQPAPSGTLYDVKVAKETELTECPSSGGNATEELDD